MPVSGVAGAGATQRTRTGLRLLAGSVLTGLAMIGCVETAMSSDDPLRPYLWRSRVVAVFAASAADPDAARQKQIIAAMAAGARERDIVVVDLIGSSAAIGAMRNRLGAPERGFAAILVGKDGGAKLVSALPIPADQLEKTIDAMPLRRQEKNRP